MLFPYKMKVYLLYHFFVFDVDGVWAGTDPWDGISVVENVEGDDDGGATIIPTPAIIMLPVITIMIRITIRVTGHSSPIISPTMFYTLVQESG